MDPPHAYDPEQLVRSPSNVLVYEVVHSVKKLSPMTLQTQVMVAVRLFYIAKVFVGLRQRFGKAL